MLGEKEQKSKKEVKSIVISMLVLSLALGLAFYLMQPLLAEFIATYFSPGLGLKDAAVIAFFVSVVLMVVLALAAGDGLLGEIQFVLSGFFLFFTIIWLSIAWIF